MIFLLQMILAKSTLHEYILNVTLSYAVLDILITNNGKTLSSVKGEENILRNDNNFIENTYVIIF